MFRNPPKVDVYVDIWSVKELVTYEIGNDELSLGANMSLTKTMELFYSLSTKNPKFKYMKGLADHIDLIANVPVRNVRIELIHIFTYMNCTL